MAWNSLGSEYFVQGENTDIIGDYVLQRPVRFVVNVLCGADARAFFLKCRARAAVCWSLLDNERCVEKSGAWGKIVLRTYEFLCESSQYER